MKTLKMAFLGGAALSVLSVVAQADDLSDLKAQIESLNARVAQMEAAPQVPAGYSLLTIAEGARPETPGLPLTARERAAYGETATVISVLPTADAPATTTITWSGYARAGLVYSDSDGDVRVRGRFYNDNPNIGPVGVDSWQDANVRSFTRYGAGDLIGVTEDGEDVYGNLSGVEIALGNLDGIDGFRRLGGSYGDDDIDVLARGQLRVNASTDTAVGEVGVDIRLRANFDGNGAGDVYSDVAWGYWAMTPELTFGGGYAGSLGNVGYGYDGACTCYYTDNAGVDFNPGDVSQLRLSYASGPFSMGVALEDASVNTGLFGDNSNRNLNGDKLGVAGELKYAGDAFSGEISGVWRGVDVGDDLWQIGAGLGFSWDMFALSIGAAMGSGPYTETDSQGIITVAVPYDQDWWGVSALAAFNFNDAWHAEIGAGYKSREGDSFTTSLGYFDHGFGIVPLMWGSNGVDQDRWAILGGIYYDPVPQLTLGLEAEWYTIDTSFRTTTLSADMDGDLFVADHGMELDFSDEVDNWTVDFVAVWRF